MRIRFYVTTLAIVLAASTLAACGGRSMTATPPTTGSTVPTASTKLSVTIPAASITASAARRHAMFVASTTAGILVQTYAQSDSSHSSLLGQSATDISSGSSACGGQTGSPRTCTIPFNAPAGADTFVITTYDAAPKNGSFSAANKLAAASVNQTINSGATNTVSVTLGGVISSLVVAVPNAQIHGTIASTQSAVVEALDANGNVIVSDGYMGANGNPVSIKLSLSPNTGNVFTLGTATLASPQLSGVQLSYSGGAAAAFTTTLSAAAGAIHANSTITLLGPAFTSSSIPTANSGPDAIAFAPPSTESTSLWFTETNANKVGLIFPSGAITEYPIAGTSPAGIAPGPPGDTNLWFVDNGSSQIERMGVDGTLFGKVSTPTTSAGLFGIIAGPDGNMWFTENHVGKVGKVTASLAVTEYPVNAGASGPFSITVGADGNLWFTDTVNNAIGRITTAGAVTEYPTPTAGSGPFGITAGPDGNVWFTEYLKNNIGVISPSGVIHEYPLPTPASSPIAITPGPDGNLWAVEQVAGKLVRITTLGKITEYAVPSAAGGLNGIVAGGDDRFYITDMDLNRIVIFDW